MEGLEFNVVMKSICEKLQVSVGELRKKADIDVLISTEINIYVCINVQYLRVHSIYIHHIINNMYYNSAGIITIFFHDVLCMILGIMWIICINIHKLGSFLNK